MIISERNRHVKLKRLISATKKRIVADIIKHVLPHMWETGFIHHPDNIFDGKGIPTIAFFFPERDRYIDGYIDSVAGYKIGSLNVEGFTAWGGVVCDCHGGGMAYDKLSDLNIEDLIKLHYWVLNTYDFANKKLFRTKLLTA